MEFYQWLVPLLAIYFGVKIVRQYLDKKRLFRSTALWLVFWTLISYLAIMPHDASVNLANLLGIKSNINAIFFIALGFLFLFNMFFTASIDRIERQMTEIIRKMALDNQDLREKVASYEMKLLEQKHKTEESSKSVSGE